MASGIYDVFKEDLFLGDVDLATDTVNVALLDNSHPTAPGDLQSDGVWADVSTNEITGGIGYVAGGKTLQTPLVTVATGTATFDADDVQWTAASFSAWHAVIYDITNTSSLIATIDFGGEQQVSSGTFEIQWNVNGIISLT